MYHYKLNFWTLTVLIVLIIGMYTKTVKYIIWKLIGSNILDTTDSSDLKTFFQSHWSQYNGSFTK